MDAILAMDIGNATTETTLAYQDESGRICHISSDIYRTTGTKGTIENLRGIRGILDDLKRRTGDGIRIVKILLNDAAPVIADFAMDTITETVITDSAVIGHNPHTPGGVGIGVGITAPIDGKLEQGVDYVLYAGSRYSFTEVAKKVNCYGAEGYFIQAVILQNDEGTLVANRINRTIPIIDEVERIHLIPDGRRCAVEVAPVGRSITILSDPFGIASVLALSAEETKHVRNVAKALAGNRSAVVIKTPKGDISERIIEAGSVSFQGARFTMSVPLDLGAEEIMKTAEKVGVLMDVQGEPGTAIGGMIENIRNTMMRLIGTESSVYISDFFAADSFKAGEIKGGLANEKSMDSGVAVAAMIREDKSFMATVGYAVEKETGISVDIGGDEAEMALKGVLTTPGVEAPFLMADIGAGSIDVAYMNEAGSMKKVNLAGAGNLITMMIRSELDLDSLEVAEKIKKYPLAHVRSLFRIDYENGEVAFLPEPLDGRYYAKTVICEDNAFHIIDEDLSMDRIRNVRRRCKSKVVSENIRRAMKMLGIDKKMADEIVLAGGGACDFEIGEILMEDLDGFRIVIGKANVRGNQGPRNAVATGLMETYLKEGRKSDGDR